MAKITIFGLAGTGTSTVGRLLADKLQVPFLSSGMVYRDQAKNLGLSVYELEKLCEKDSSYDRTLDEHISLFGKLNDDFVVESRLAWHFIPDSFKVKLFCSDEVRFERVAMRESISVTQAEQLTRFREHSSGERYKNIYNIRDIGPDDVFDLIIDTNHTKSEEVVEKILDRLAKIENK